jgi:putative transposase
MAKRKGEFLPDHYYHIYNRGANRQPIFFEEDNYLFLLKKVNIFSAKYQMTVIAYCLMPNHFHFLLKQDAEESVSKFMQAVFNSYSKAINLAYHRSGTLFQGPFKSVLIESNEYLLHLCRYIHRNPLDGGLVDNLEN